MNCVVDPALFALPGASADSAATRRWATALAAWTEEVRACPATWSTFLGCLAQLEAQGRLASFASLRSLARSGGWEDFDVERVGRMVNEFLMGGDRDVGVHLTTVSALLSSGLDGTPQDFFDRNHGVARELEEGLSCLLVDKVAAEPFASSSAVVTFGPLPANALRLKGELAMALPERPNLHTLEAAFQLLLTPDHLVGMIDVGTIVRAGAEAFRSEIRRVALKECPAGTTPVECSLGGSFWNSLTGCGILTQPVALGRVIRTAAFLANRCAPNSAKIRPMRQRKAANSPQLSRKSDSAKAWRATIEQTGVGWRMNYWHRPPIGAAEELIELGNIQQKGESPRIPE